MMSAVPPQDQFKVDSRSDFDEFWVSGIEHGQMHPADVLGLPDSQAPLDHGTQRRVGLA